MSDDKPPRRLASSTLTSGVVTAFIALASLAGLAGANDRQLSGDWKLRGTMVPTAAANPVRTGG